jgi:hypothetical protein
MLLGAPDGRLADPETARSTLRATGGAIGPAVNMIQS